MDNVTGVKYGGENVLALYCDASFGTGWWFEGGGLFRHNWLVSTDTTHLEPDGTWSYAEGAMTSISVWQPAFIIYYLFRKSPPTPPLQCRIGWFMLRCSIVRAARCTLDGVVSKMGLQAPPPPTHYRLYLSPPHLEHHPPSTITYHLPPML